SFSSAPSLRVFQPQALSPISDVLCHTPLLGNDLSSGSIVAVSPVDHDEQSSNYIIIFPSDYTGIFTFD
ncbi:MAG TPA: hypothetical protein PKE58_02945, partial [Acidobacteriota bacterium]|nr:hypothetical protein [Acidobacteriota bacterium]